MTLLFGYKYKTRLQNVARHGSASSGLYDLDQGCPSGLERVGHNALRESVMSSVELSSPYQISDQVRLCVT